MVCVRQVCHSLSHQKHCSVLKSPSSFLAVINFPCHFCSGNIMVIIIIIFIINTITIMIIESKNFQPDCLPPVESTDLLFYLVLEMSFYTQEQLKSFRSLEAYNQMVSGFITSLKGHIIANKFVV